MPFVVVTSWLIVLLGDALPIRSLRVVRVLRPLRSVKRIKGLRVVVEAIMSSLPAISSVCVVGLAMLTMLSVLGMELFLGKMHRCTHTAVAVANKTQCLAAGGVWRKAKFNFDSFPEAFLSVFIIATGDNWQDLMYEAMDVVGVKIKNQSEITRSGRAFTFSYRFSLASCSGQISLCRRSSTTSIVSHTSENDGKLLRHR